LLKVSNGCKGGHMWCRKIWCWCWIRWLTWWHCRLVCMPCGWETQTTGICGRGVMAMERVACGVVRLGAGVQVNVESMWRVLHNRCKHRQKPITPQLQVWYPYRCQNSALYPYLCDLWPKNHGFTCTCVEPYAHCIIYFPVCNSFDFTIIFSMSLHSGFVWCAVWQMLLWSVEQCLPEHFFIIVYSKNPDL